MKATGSWTTFAGEKAERLKLEMKPDDRAVDPCVPRRRAGGAISLRGRVERQLLQWHWKRVAEIVRLRLRLRQRTAETLQQLGADAAP